MRRPISARRAWALARVLCKRQTRRRQDPPSPIRSRDAPVAAPSFAPLWRLEGRGVRAFIRVKGPGVGRSDCGFAPPPTLFFNARRVRAAAAARRTAPAR